MSQQTRINYIGNELLKTIPLFIIWSLVSTVLLLLFGFFRLNDANYINLNGDAAYNIGLIYVAHAIAFTAVPSLYLIFKSSFNKFFVMALTIAGIGVLAVQYSWRDLSDGTGRMDCSSNCVPTVIPESLGTAINIRVMIMLIALLIVFVSLAILRVKYSKKDREKSIG